MDLTIIGRSVGGSSLTWLASDHGASAGQTRTLDISKFTSGTHYDATTKVIPSGVALAVVTATGLYGPYDTGASDGRQLKLDSYLLTDQSLLQVDGSVSTRVGAAVTVHALIHQTLLPVTAQRTIVAAAATTGLFSYQD